MSQEQTLHSVGSTILFEDDTVRVWDATVEPGETLPIHQHDLDYVTVALTRSDVEVHEADGTVRRGHRVPGDVQVTRVGSGQRHMLKNIGTATHRNRIIELKSPPGPGGEPVNINLSR